MEDIVEPLRTLAHGERIVFADDMDLLIEAADTIDSLRTQLAAAQAEAEGLRAKHDAALDLIIELGGELREPEFDEARRRAAELVALRAQIEALRGEQLQGAVISTYSVGGLKIDRVRQVDGTDKWAVRNAYRECLGRKGWEDEPMSSSRDDEFLARCRYDSAAQALAALNAAIAATAQEKT